MKRNAGYIVGSVALAWLVATTSAFAAVPEIRVLSNRADLVSGGNALVEVVGVDPSQMRVAVDGRDVTTSFTARSAGRAQALLTGLKVGANVVTVRLPGATTAKLTITNHPIGGPILAGKQVEPWFCHNEEYGLRAAVDAQCNTAPVVVHQYKDASNGEFKAYDPSNPPPVSSVATTTTDEGKTVPYIVRIERGVLDRGVYELAVLADPGKPWSPLDPSLQPRWNHKVYWTFGGDCTANHVQFNAVGANKDLVVSRGFLSGVASTTNLGSNCNSVGSAEALMMLKEHIVETYGAIRYTMSEGCSGGSMQQNWHTSNYPGLLDGIQPSCSFPDLWEIIQSSGDCHLLNRVFDHAPQTWTADKQGAVAGHQSATSCRTLMQVGADLWLDPENASACIGGITGVLTGTLNETPAATDALTERPDWAYNAQSNPEGERCDIHDFMEAVFGWRPASAWGSVEKNLGHGFANRPFDNVGVQYGLQALLSGVIAPEEFVSLNEQIGGIDIDYNPVPERSVADPGALDVVYRAGLVTNLREQRKVPVIDIRGSSNYEIHNDYHSYVQRARMNRSNGGHENQIIWTMRSLAAGGPADDTATAESISLLDRWLARIEVDQRDVPLERKVIDNKPADAVDACWLNGRKVTDMATCRAVYPYYAGPRIAAGGPWTDDVVKCQLRTLNREEYYGVTFSDDQWARLQKVFAGGACDYRKPSVGHQPSIPWLTYAAGPGGRPLGAPPRSKLAGPAGRCRARHAVEVQVRGLRRVSVRLYIGGRQASRRTFTVRRRGELLSVHLRTPTKRAVRVTVAGIDRKGRAVGRTRRVRGCGA